jgi:hypothetical protein
VNLKKSSKQISEILVDINSGHGALGKVIRDPTMANDLAQTMLNLKYGSQGLDDLLKRPNTISFLEDILIKRATKTIRKKAAIVIGYRKQQVANKLPTSYLGGEHTANGFSVQIELDTLMTSLKISAINSEVITKQLADIMLMINSGKGTLGMLVQDTVLANVINQTLMNLKSSSKGLDENMNAAKENFLLKGYFERKKKAADKKKEDDLKKKAEQENK